MSWSHDLARLTFAAMLLVPGAGWSPAAAAADIAPCPARPEGGLKYLDVFDGAPEEMATLMEDKSGKNFGYFTLGHIYDEGRFVTIRCKYADGFKTDVKLPDKVAGCKYTVGKDKALNLSCH